MSISNQQIDWGAVEFPQTMMTIKSRNTLGAQDRNMCHDYDAD